MFPGKGGAEGGRIKVNLFRRNFLQGQGWAPLCKTEKIYKEINKYPSYLLSNCLSNLIPGFLVRSKFQIPRVFSDTNHGIIRGTLTTNIFLVSRV